MTAIAIDLTIVWAVLLAIAVFLYVCMDGFDLGVGILFPVVRGKAERDLIVNSVAPFWDGNETWLILGGGGLLAVFPLAYAIIMPALYMPIILMLLALIFRGVAFEMRFRADGERARLWWDRSFSWGSYAAALCQGIALGALVQGIRIEGRAYGGGWWDWLTPFSLFTGVAVVIGYGLLGCCWLVWKLEGEMQDRVRVLARWLAFATLGCILVVSLIMPFLQPAFRARWFAFPAILAALPVPALVALLGWRLLAGLDDVGRRANAGETVPDHDMAWRDSVPFFCALGLFFLSYTGLGISLWPLIVPPDVTIWDAAASPSSQAFLLVGATVLIPIILGYTAYVYWLFRGKMRAGAGYH